MEDKILQLRFLELVKQKHGSEDNWIETLAELLNISKSGVYKKIRSDTLLSLGEIAVLMKKYNVGIDEMILGKKSNIDFYFPYLEREVKSFADYILPLKKVIGDFYLIPHLQIFYATSELPFFYYYMSKDLTYFKLFTYAQTTWELPGYAERKFNLDKFAEYPVLKEDIDELLKMYFQMPNTEFWKISILNNTLNQIRTFLYGGLFEIPEQSLILLDELRRLMKHVCKMAECGCKFMPEQKGPDKKSKPFHLYHNEIVHSNNTLLVLSDHLNAVFNAYDNPNFIISSNDLLIEHTKTWFERIKKSAVSVSKDARTNRLYLFDQIEQNISWTQRELEVYLARLKR